MYKESDLLPISALQHILYCERQYALIHIEQVWGENLYTAQGQVLHNRVDIEHHEHRQNQKIEYGMALRSLEFGLIGKADVVEFVMDGKEYKSIKPVEYKRGRKKFDDCDRVQLCAQGLCLEEMFSTSIPTGDFYYLQEHRRTSLNFGDDLREKTIATIKRGVEIREKGETPLVCYNHKKCDNCSLYEICMPKIFNPESKKVKLYVRNQVRINQGTDNL